MLARLTIKFFIYILFILVAVFLRHEHFHRTLKAFFWSGKKQKKRDILDNLPAVWKTVQVSFIDMYWKFIFKFVTKFFLKCELLQEEHGVPLGDLPDMTR